MSPNQRHKARQTQSHQQLAVATNRKAFPCDRPRQVSLFLALAALVAFLSGLDACGGAPAQQQQAAKSREQLPTPPSRVRIADSPTPTPPPKVAPTVDSQGSVVTVLPDGSKRITRPGACGYTIVRPDGTRNTVSCAQVQPATPPLVDEVSAKWLQAHSETLLSIIRSLVDETSVKNYLATSEENVPDVYTQIRLRTDLVRLLIAP